MRKINKSHINEFEPFIVLPQGTMQEGIYCGSKFIRSIEDIILETINRSIGNTRVVSNVIRVQVNVRYIIVVHLFPSDIRETFSGRIGQKVVVGFVISKKLLYFNHKQAINQIIQTFSSLMEICKEYSRENQSFPDSLLSNSTSYRFYQRVAASLMQTININQHDTISTPISTKICEIYKNIRLRSIFNYRFNYLKCDDKLYCLPDKELRKKLVETRIKSHTPIEEESEPIKEE